MENSINLKSKDNNLPLEKTQSLKLVDAEKINNEKTKLINKQNAEKYMNIERDTKILDTDNILSTKKKIINIDEGDYEKLEKPTIDALNNLTNCYQIFHENISGNDPYNVIKHLKSTIKEMNTQKKDVKVDQSYKNYASINYDETWNGENKLYNHFSKFSCLNLSNNDQSKEHIPKEAKKIVEKNKEIKKIIPLEAGKNNTTKLTKIEDKQLTSTIDESHSKNEPKKTSKKFSLQKKSGNKKKEIPKELLIKKENSSSKVKQLGNEKSISKFNEPPKDLRNDLSLKKENKSKIKNSEKEGQDKMSLSNKKIEKEIAPVSSSEIPPNSGVNSKHDNKEKAKSIENERMIKTYDIMESDNDKLANMFSNIGSSVKLTNEMVSKILHVMIEKKYVTEKEFSKYFEKLLVNPNTKIIILIYLFFINNISCNENRKLLLVSSIWRHGLRSPCILIKGTKYNERFWKRPLENLISNGQIDMMKQGKKLRKRYMYDLKFLSIETNPNELFIRSTNYTRTIESANILLSSFLRGQSKYYPSTPEWLANYTPIAVYIDFFGYPYIWKLSLCKKFEITKKKREQSKNALKYKEQNKEMLDDILNISQIDDESTICCIFDYFNIIEKEKLEFPKQMTKSHFSKLTNFFNNYYLHSYGEALLGDSEDVELIKYSGGIILKNIFENFFNRMNTSDDSNFGTKFFGYSAHDNYIHPILLALGIKQQVLGKHYIDAGAMIIFELYQNLNNNHFDILILFSKNSTSPLEKVTKYVPNCQFNDYCNYQEIYEQISKYLPKDILNELHVAKIYDRLLSNNYIKIG
ncbi:Histidine phosphatase superfamily, clade-2-containing protein [Strongyloides ratti]|uniref:2-phosphoxylose phosphatase 1 n=1 Tax=Strongyloides ratti TaxID=34506 RepID=A0A090MWU3_STRRB|nr:Histidine phosphatase superfamily, clade-2-containing protein [Strongyloides ratti]CEF64284.2 Histidine phosphatase superfamily, clade-2-containing protein [Strongyloides ratti]